MNVTAEKETAAILQGSFNFTKKELLNQIDSAITAYRHFDKKLEHLSFLVEGSTIARYIAYNTFESFLYASSHKDWTYFYRKVWNILDEVADRRDRKFYITPETQGKIRLLISGCNMRLEKTEQTADSVQVNLLDCLEEKAVTIYYCKLCSYKSEIRLELLVHLESHSLKDLRNPKEESQ